MMTFNKPDSKNVFKDQVLLSFVTALFNPSKEMRLLELDTGCKNCQSVLILIFIHFKAILAKMTF